MPASVDQGTPADFNRLMDMAGKSGTEQKAEIPPIRAAALDESAMTFGAQGGLAFRSGQIKGELKRMERDLDIMFDFSPYVFKGNVLLPVIIDAEDVVKTDADGQSQRRADFFFKIETPARFVTNKPTWRDYLSFEASATPSVPHNSVLPKNTAEQEYWNAALKKGWDSGVKQADDILKSSLARLKRDTTGRLVYRTLLKYKMVPEPVVAQSELGVTGDGNQMAVRDRILRITVNPSLQVNSKEWEAVIKILSEK